MTFSPIIPVGGLVGLTLLNRTLARQTELFNQSPTLRRDTEYFEQNIAAVQTVEDLVSDRRLLRVALGAFGLQDDIDSRAFIGAILKQGTEAPDALANRLADDRYRRFSDAFGFSGSAPPRTGEEGFAASILDKFRRREFETAVGLQDESLRLALNAERELAELALDEGSDNALWFRILGTPPLRRVFEVALGLPRGFGQLDIDRQLEEFKSRSGRQFGAASPKDFAQIDIREALSRQFLLREQLSSVGFQSSQAIALSLLQNGR
ncbi:DUF1217 domain-containing protein [Roseovarius autotrophicus]|uniref:DUF1217 domain-containing protein n=1 Tax=Roseovarius autotrophicus TaxID=2824121 RepID=UPI0019D81928|nr:DUF1217 domain-containing protein [Roseovarius autotrophicus]MBE0455475.1 DUF1217 domain-containing protein [Roseovarius sp.]